MPTSADSATVLWCVVPAAGTGRRYGAPHPKQYELLAGRSVLGWSLRALLATAGVRGIALPLAAGDEAWRDVPECGDARVSLCRGGAQRAESVLLGIAHLRARGAEDDDQVLVHDAARPATTPELVERLLAAVAAEPDGGLLALPVGDTLKAADANARATATPSRAGLWAAQTPQCFPLGRLYAALIAAPAQPITDEAAAMEALGARPKLVAGDPGNIKLTRPADRRVLETLLAAREQQPA